MAKKVICKNCKSLITPKPKSGGNLSTELILWLTPIIATFAFYVYFCSAYANMTFKEFYELINEIVTVGSQQPLYLNYSEELPRLYGIGTLVFASFNIWFLASIYSLWRFFVKKKCCPACGQNQGFVPLNTPEGKRMRIQNNAK